ncbi:MAG: hypothetical protein Q7T03_10190 [Deltaproteobacteria bacterium]|nr:hypothetical protein [Deltaproteobacteria bacterium]
MCDSDLIKIVVTSSLTLFATLFVAYCSQQWTLNGQKELKDKEARQLAFSELMGLKLIRQQLFLSRFEAVAYSDYHEQRWQLQGAQKDSLDFSEATRWQHKAEDFVQDISSNTEKLFNVLGRITILFPATPEIDQLIEKLYRFKTPKFNVEAKSIQDLKNLEGWKLAVTLDLQKIVETEYGKPFDDLVTYLKPQLLQKNCR